MGSEVHQSIRRRPYEGHDVSPESGVNKRDHTYFLSVSWGESAGAISVALQMVTNGGNAEGLFRAAFMESGSLVPVGSITGGQVYYDNVVSLTGCSGAADTLACLRTVSYDALGEAINNSPGIFTYHVRGGNACLLGDSLTEALPLCPGLVIAVDPSGGWNIPHHRPSSVTSAR